MTARGQVAAVGAAPGDDFDDVAVRGALCFTRAELTMRSHPLLYRNALAERITKTVRAPRT